MQTTSFWASDAPSPESESLHGRLDADVCVVGGGFAGLWAALEIRRRDPGRDVVLVERDEVGAAATGRNGGLILSYLRELPRLIARLGDVQAAALVSQSYRVIDELERWALEYAPDARFSRPGHLWASTSASQDGAWLTSARHARRLGIDALILPIDGEHARALVPSPLIREGALCAEGAAVDPVGLARGVKVAALAAGVRIFERTPAVSIDVDRATIATPAGEVRARRLLLAIGPWSARLRELRRLIVPVSSHVLVTEPLADMPRRWPHRTVFTDAQTMVHYAQVTFDGRLVLGRGGGAFGPAGRVTRRVVDDERTARELRGDLALLFPQWADAAIAAAWAGAVDRSASGMPFVVALGARANTLALAGFSGKGIVPTVLAARAAASHVTGADDEYARHPFLNAPQRAFPHEPLRSAGATLVRAAVKRKEGRELRRRSVGPLTRRAAELAWFSLPRRARVPQPPSQQGVMP